MDDALSLLLCLGVPALLIGALVFLVRKTKEQEEQTKQEIAKLVNSMPESSRGTFLMQYNSQKKNPTAAVVLALFLGGVGAHRFYLGETGIGIIYLLFVWTFIPAIIAFFEAFTISHKVHKVNRRAAREAATLVSGGGAVKSFT